MASTLLADKTPPFCSLEIKQSFDLLTQTEKLYTYYVTQASWAGARIIQEQWTGQATQLFDLLIAVFGDGGKLVNLQSLQKKAGLSDDAFDSLLQYSAQTLSNLVNYKSFGATKFVPRAQPEEFEALVKAASSAQASDLWEKLKDHIYATTPEASTAIGKPTDGHVSNYYLGETITDEEVASIQTAAEGLGLDVFNTRVQKDSGTSFTLLIASAEVQPEKTVDMGKHGTLRIRYGDMQKPLAKAVAYLEKAKEHARNEHQTKMIEGYIKSFASGSIPDHKEASRHWVKDVGPVVESYIGFIETYVDPYGARAEWEGFTAIVNKTLSKKYEELVDNAPHFIESLPWGKDFEVDTFRRPDFTALEVVSFATGGILDPRSVVLTGDRAARARSGMDGWTRLASPGC
ncbi:Dipeptidyl peptidase 3 [Mycena chlorophos]|uniref:Dipeptidyl peptidase 3 n=1 Tax=Mycena chlorophos TaxID=658473 RepID=A0A8H6TPR1_MYCCL|nr:Dipeptidyl peptidase 3 [Mycena chlorophos]